MSDPGKPDELVQFASDLQSMRMRAINLRLPATGQRLESAIHTLGLEIAGDPDRRRKNEDAAKRQVVFFAKGPELLCREATPCADCGSTESEMRTYGGSWDDADIHCAKCKKLIHRAWLPVKVG